MNIHIFFEIGLNFIEFCFVILAKSDGISKLFQSFVGVSGLLACLCYLLEIHKAITISRYIAKP